MISYAQSTIEAAKKLLADPMYKVDEEGRVWKRVGLPDASGKRAVGYRTNKDTWLSVPVTLLVYLAHVGEIDPDKKVLVSTIDGDPNNLRPDNLRLVEKTVYTPRHISADVRAAMLKDHKDGASPLQIAEKYGFAITQVKKTLFNGNGR